MPGRSAGRCSGEGEGVTFEGPVDEVFGGVAGDGALGAGEIRRRSSPNQK